MGPTYFLATLDPISPEELRAFIARLGGGLDDDPHWDGAFATRRGRLNIKWATKEHLESILAGDLYVDTPRGVRARQKDYETLASIVESLGGPPHDFVELDLLSGWPSQHLAVWFVESFTKRWSPWALDTLDSLDLAEEGKVVWAMDDVLRLVARQRRLPFGRQDFRLGPDYFELQQRAQDAVDHGLPEPPVTYRHAEYVLATLATVSQDELRAFIVEQGGLPYDEYCYDGAFAHPSRSGNMIAVDWATDLRFRALQRWDPYLHRRRGARRLRESHADMARIVEALGARPHDIVELHLLDPIAQPTAAAFVEAFAKRWSPTVLETGFNHTVAEGGKLVWPMDEVLSLIRTEHRLPTLRPGIENWRELFLK